MKLLLKEDLAKLQAQDPYHESSGLNGKELPDDKAMVIVKFFTPDANWTWYAVSASKDEESGDVQFFGLVEGNATEFGYFWLSELEKARGLLGLPVERDMYWTPILLSELKRKVL